jgi:hypothetical protein
LPEGYKAFLGGVPALTVASGNGKPDVSVRQWGPRPAAEKVATGAAVLEPDLEGDFVPAARLRPRGVRVQAVRRLREEGETVLCILPGHEHEAQEFDCDRELAAVSGNWVLRAL